ncbi:MULTISPECIES: UrcA family protein [unclassified Sphingomonas]|uniref:UrcA family protein n=1 Tax=unclassified Sphingomonas TaxID=196159 RepID=UPI002150FE80|nr:MULTISPECIES: UrcA family protein [unclassified Sphingomonas]MCR5871991.1 UrcA family protein [Sphingomonas sp. J344]UUX99734.1 UrcA family protein [Sphingomonas sp. J315]
MITNFARAAALGAALLVSLPTVAGQGKHVRVSYADLDLTADAGKKTFERRIARAADAVCGPTDGRDLAGVVRHKRCVATALESSRPAVELAFRNSATRQLAARDQSIRVAP